MTWKDFFLLFLVLKSLHLDVKFKYEASETFKMAPFFKVSNSYIRPLMKNTNFGIDTWNLDEIHITSEHLPVYFIRSGFHLIYGGNEFVNKHMHLIHAGPVYFGFTKLPHLSLEGQHIVARHPLTYPSSFNPLFPLDFWTWFCTVCSFLSLGLLLIVSHFFLRPTKISLYYFSEIWRDLNWFKTSSLLLFLWAATFFWINSAYQIDFRTGLIGQRLENPVDSWNDVDIFNMNLFTFSINKLSPISIKNNLIHKNLLVRNLHTFR